MKTNVLICAMTATLLIGCQSYDSRGFNPVTKNHSKTNTSFDESGFDINGFDRFGFNKQGFDHYGFDRNGFNLSGFDGQGFDRNGLDKNGFDRNGICKETGSRFDKNGFDQQGLDSSGFDRDGYDLKGFSRDGKPRKVSVVFTSDSYIKDLRIDGFTVDWPTATVDEFVVDRKYSITRPLPKSNSVELAVETDVVVEYVNYAMNGFGRHSNESFKKRKVRIKYIRGMGTYYVNL